jgi:hypothetical protein
MPVSFLVVAVNLSVRLYCTENDRGRLHIEDRHIEDRQHFIALVVDVFYGDLAGFGRVEGGADGRVEGGPGHCVDFGPQGPLELVVGFVGAGAQSAASTPAAVVLVSGSRPRCRRVAGLFPSVFSAHGGPAGLEASAEYLRR